MQTGWIKHVFHQHRTERRTSWSLPIPVVAVVAVVAMFVFMTAINANASSARDRVAAEQIRLDETCESSRQAILSVERAQYIEECVEKEQRPDRASCERFYADHGARAGNRAPLYLDLPECVEAHEFRQQNR